MAHHPHIPPFTLAALAAALVAPAAAQTDTTQLAPVQVTGRAAPPLNVGGWGDVTRIERRRRQALSVPLRNRSPPP